MVLSMSAAGSLDILLREEDTPNTMTMELSWGCCFCTRQLQSQIQAFIFTGHKGSRHANIGAHDALSASRYTKIYWIPPTRKSEILNDVGEQRLMRMGAANVGWSR